MADGVHIFQRAVAQHTAGKLGLRTDQPTTTASNQKTQRNTAEVYAVPVDASNWHPLQVLDPGSSNFGLFYFMPGYSIPGGPDVVL